MPLLLLWNVTFSGFEERGNDNRLDSTTVREMGRIPASLLKVHGETHSARTGFLRL